jgi:hypothetical protein
MTEKEELLKRLHSLNDQGFLKYLIKTGWCMREAWDLFIDDLDDKSISEELQFLKDENIGNSALANEA